MTGLCGHPLHIKFLFLSSTLSQEKEYLSIVHLGVRNSCFLVQNLCWFPSFSLFINPKGQITAVCCHSSTYSGSGPIFASCEFHPVAVIHSLCMVFPVFLLITQQIFSGKNISPSQCLMAAKSTVIFLFPKAGLKHLILLMHLKKMMAGLVPKIH